MTVRVTKKYPYFESEEFPNLLNELKLFFGSPDPGTVISAPINGTHFRVKQILQDHRDEFSSPLVVVDLGMGMDDMRTIEDHISSKGYVLGKDKIFLFVLNGSYCLKSKNENLLTDLANLQRDSDQTKMVYFFESDIFSDENVSIIKSKTILSQVFYFPMFDEIEARDYLQYLANIWNMTKVSKKTVVKIAKECSGHIWLLNQAMREYRNNKTVDLDNLLGCPGFSFRLDLISKAFTSSEIEVLLGNTKKQSSSHTYLTSIGFLKNGICAIPTLYEYLKNTQKTMHLEIDKDHVHFNQVNLMHSFTYQEEQLLKILLQNLGKPVNRDAIAEVIWRGQHYEKYSEWAIEQLIRRLRKKLDEIGLSQNYIKTCRGEGYKIVS